MDGVEKPLGGAGGADTTALWLRKVALLFAIALGWKAVKPVKPLDCEDPPLFAL